MKKFSLFLFLFACSLALYSQEQKSVIDLLTSKQWYLQGMTDKTSSEQFTRTEQNSYLNGELLGTFNYYLSDTIDETFDFNKIGTVNDGKYIVSKAKDNSLSNFSVYEIISISPDSLEIRFVENTHTLKYK